MIFEFVILVLTLTATTGLAATVTWLALGAKARLDKRKRGR